MLKIPDTSSQSFSRIYWFLLALLLAPWLYLRLLQVTHSDILWLSEAAQRILAGGSMSGNAFDPNPPLSIILYMLPVLAQKYLSIPLHLGVLIQAFCVLVASSMALRRILQNFQDVTLDVQRLIVCAFSAFNTIGTGLVFGERDHLIAMVLPPFVLLQLSLTLYPDKKFGFWSWGFSGLSSILILLKPPHGLLPTILILHRIIIRRNLSAFNDRDFLSLLYATLGYCAVIVLLFPDYVTEILADMMAYYYPSVSDGSLTKSLLLLLGSITALAAFTCITKIPTASKKLIIFLLIGAAVSIIPVAVQVKGFYYHYLPSLVFLFSGAALLAYELLIREVSKPAVVALGMSVICVTLTLLIAPPVTDYPRHGSYMHLPLPALISENLDARKNNSIFIFNDDMSLSHEIAYYGGFHHASRFPSLWFLPGLYNAREHNKAWWPQERDRYAAMIAEDLEKDKPGLVLLLSPENFAEKIDPIEFFMPNKAFKAAWSHYAYVQSTTIYPADYFGTAAGGQPAKTFKIFRRQ